MMASGNGSNSFEAFPELMIDQDKVSGSWGIFFRILC